jgi:hypothetical protein
MQMIAAMIPKMESSSVKVFANLLGFYGKVQLIVFGGKVIGAKAKVTRCESLAV